MTLNIKNAFKRVINEPAPSTQVSSRNDIYEHDTTDEEAVKEDAQRMDALMRQILGGDEEDDETEEDEAEEPQDMEDVDQENNEEEEGGFSFRLFASQPVATVNIEDGTDNTDNWSKLVADQQVYEFDETDPEFVARAQEAAIDYETIVKQSTVPYPAMRFPKRIIHILSPEEEQAIKEASTEKKKKAVKKRKSKKCRDFEKAVKEGKIELKPNMRNPKTPDGWPGWPGNLTRVAIVDYDAGKKKKGYNNSNNNASRGGGFRGRGVSRGTSRGGMVRGRGRGRSF